MVQIRHRRVVDLAWILARTKEAPAPAHVSHLGPCRLWTGSLGVKGYASISYEGRSQGGHRLAWEFANGTRVPEGLVVRHKCDVRPCVEPAHLETGTCSENTRDAVERGRWHGGQGRPPRADGLAKDSDEARAKAGLGRLSLRLPEATLARWRELAGDEGITAWLLRVVPK